MFNLPEDGYFKHYFCRVAILLFPICYRPVFPDILDYIQPLKPLVLDKDSLQVYIYIYIYIYIPSDNEQ